MLGIYVTNNNPYTKHRPRTQRPSTALSNRSQSLYYTQESCPDLLLLVGFSHKDPLLRTRIVCKSATALRIRTLRPSSHTNESTQTTSALRIRAHRPPIATGLVYKPTSTLRIRSHKVPLLLQELCENLLLSALGVRVQRPSVSNRVQTYYNTLDSRTKTPLLPQETRAHLLLHLGFTHKDVSFTAGNVSRPTATFRTHTPRTFSPVLTCSGR